jgi:phospholipid/cholesterol/gamma-HCH transport system permease protein
MRFPSPEAFAKRIVASVQEYSLLTWHAIAAVFSRPRYIDDTFTQMDYIGFGSIPIVILTGFFTGCVLTLQSATSLKQFGAVNMTGRLVALSMVKELGPVLTGLMVSGRNAGGMASELGSMQVTEQIDAMRALGTDPMKKLVTPRMLSTVVTLFLLTIISDTVGTAGGAFVAVFINNQNGTQYFTSAYQALVYADIAQGLIKPLFFGFIIATIGCFFGIKTTGGTQGVGRSTTQAVVVSSILIIFFDFLLSRAMLWAFSGF